jgi:glycosyltransferase involved in cell wall biosynthesis
MSKIDGLDERSSSGSRGPKKRGFYSGRVSYRKHMLIRTLYLTVDVVLLVPLLIITGLSRFASRPIDVGIGPSPTINSRYHKRCLARFGYSSETFVYHTWYFTRDFDVNIGRYCPRALGPYVCYLFCLFRYKCIYTYFGGGPLGFTTLLARCEPFLMSLAGIKTVLMPFGADVHVLTRSKNLLVVSGYAQDYPGFRQQRRRTASLLDVWTRGADHIISGCDWVDYMYHWDTLMLSHFAIDTDSFKLEENDQPLDELCVPLRLIHAPNHRALKGTDHILRAVDDLRSEGIAIELAIAEGIPNERMSSLIHAADVVVDQLVLGWYAMFAIESMALGKPVICHIRPQYRDLYVGAGLIGADELPLIDASIFNIKETLRRLASVTRRELRNIGLRSRSFVEKHHSIEAIGVAFDRINRNLDLPRSLMKKR